MIDIMSIIHQVKDVIWQILKTSFKIPLTIWFVYVPAPVRWFVVACLTIFSVYMLWWAWKNRDGWMKVYNY